MTTEGSNTIDEPGMSNSTMRWIVVALAVVSLVMLLAYARGKPGVDGRDPGPDEGAYSTSLVIGG